MKTRLIAFSVIVLLLSMHSAGNCYTNNSFRNESTAFTLDDDLDQWMADYSQSMPNPSGLFKFDGYRLYTNLSNLVDKNESMFSNGSRNNFLLGGSGHLHKGYRFGSIANRFGDRWKNASASDRSEFTDNDGNGAYDTRRRFLASNVTDDIENRTGFTFALAGKRDKIDYGIAFTVRTQDNSTEMSSSADTTDTDLITNLNNRTAHGESLNFAKQKIGSQSVTVGGLYRYTDNISLGARLGIAMTSDNDYGKGNTNYSEDRSPSDADMLDVTYRNNEFKIGEKHSGNRINVGLTMEMQASDNIFSIFEITGYTGSSDDNGGTYSRTIRETMYQSLGQDTAFTTVLGTVAGDNAFDMKNRGLTLYHRDIVELSEKVTLAFGLSLSGSKWESTLLTSPDSVSVELFDDGDNEPNDPDDFTRTVTSSYTTRVMTTADSVIFSMPVGMEFYPLKKLAVRLGARFQYVSTELETTNMLLESSSSREMIVFGDGRVTEALLDNPYDPYVSRSTLAKRRDYSTAYYYGAGWNVTENLTLDFMTFAALTDLANWKLSAVFKFF